MKTTTVRTNKEAEINASYETSKFAMTVGMTMAALVGIWGCACMISGVLDGGLGGLVKGLVSAITGN